MSHSYVRSMRLLPSVGLALALGLVAIQGCGSGDDVPEVLGTDLLEADLTGGQEVPPVDTAATGSADIAVNKNLNTIGFTLRTRGLENIVAAHIHSGDPGVPGPVIFTLSTTSSDDVTGILGSDDLSPDPDAGINSIDDAIDAMLDGRTYVNVHTAAHPDGEIRGQIFER